MSGVHLGCLRSNSEAVMVLSTCHMCLKKAIVEHFRARRRLRFGGPDIVWSVQSRSMVSVDQHVVVNFDRGSLQVQPSTAR